MTETSAAWSLFGRLTWDSLAILHQPILLWTFVVVALLGAGIVGVVSYYRLWGWLWREWFTSVDHKKIGIMYIILGIVMLLRGFSDALMMRLQQALAFGASQGYLLAFKAGDGASPGEGAKPVSGVLKVHDNLQGLEVSRAPGDEPQVSANPEDMSIDRHE